MTVNLEELKSPFFARRSTKQHISQLATSTRLTIVAGAGVTIDRTGKSWDDLIIHLLTNTDLNPGALSEDRAADIVNMFSPQQAGSVAQSKYKQMWPDGEDYADHIGYRIRGPLYARPDWLGGRLPSAIAELWLLLVSRGCDVRILTTNYDTHIEQAIHEAIDIWGDRLDRAKLDELNENLADGSCVEHLHGIVPYNGSLVHPIVVSEADYVRTSRRTESALIDALEERDALVVGASLNDPPLVSALVQTAESARSSDCRRTVMIAREAIRPGADSDDLDVYEADRIRAFEQRLEQLEAVGIYFDHYSQVAQFLSEVRLAADLPPNSYADSSNDHSRRLQDWWTRWYKPVEPRKKYPNVQAHHHMRLVSVLRAIAKDLRAEEEELRMDLWLRWQPTGRSRENRVLRMWASSAVEFEHWTLSPVAPIERNSKYYAVQAFVAGRAVYEPAAPEERWRSFVAIPLEPTESPVNLVVGSIVIASMRSGENSCLSEGKRGLQKQAFLRALSVGAELTAARGASRPKKRPVPRSSPTP